MKTLQQAFTTMVLHLRSQAKQSLDLHGHCVYRSPEGLKCAVGCLISEENYSSRLEGSNVQGGFVKAALVREGYEITHNFMDMVGDTQQVHDTFSNAALWGPKLQEIADKYSLVYP